MLQWIVVAILVYVIYYLVNKYEKKLNLLSESIELNKSEIIANKDFIEKNKSKIVDNHEKIQHNRKHIDINQDMLVRLKD